MPASPGVETVANDEQWRAVSRMKSCAPDLHACPATKQRRVPVVCNGTGTCFWPRWPGWAHNTRNYYESVRSTLGSARTEATVRLFMAPGMTHCSGGPGPSQVDWITALEQWVEKGVAPTRIVASRVANGVVDRTRPLCAYPQVARYSGKGSTDEAANFSCVAPGAKP